MSILPSTDIESTLYRLLPWTKKDQSGISQEEIVECEQKLGKKIPQPLRTLYLIAGKDETLMSSFNNFIPLDQLIIRDNKLIFVEEHQGANWWGAELDNENEAVYMQLSEDGEWISEEFGLQEFIALLIYNQCIQMGYKYCGITEMPGDQLYEVLETEWEKVVDYNGLHIYWQPGALIWSLEFGDEEDIENDIYFSTYSDELYYLNEIRYQLAEI